MDMKSGAPGIAARGAWRPVRKGGVAADEALKLTELSKVVGRTRREPAPSHDADELAKVGGVDQGIIEALAEPIGKALDVATKLAATLRGVPGRWLEANAKIDACMDDVVDGLWASAQEMLSEGTGLGTEAKVATLALRGAMAFRYFIERDGSDDRFLERLAAMAKCADLAEVVVAMDKELFEIDLEGPLRSGLPMAVGKVDVAQVNGAREVARLMRERRPTGPGRLAREFMALQSKLRDGVAWRENEVEIYEGSWFFVAASSDGRRYEFGWGPTWWRQRDEREMLAASLGAMFCRYSMADRLKLRQGEGDHVLWPGKNSACIEAPEEVVRRGISLELTVEGDGVEAAREWVIGTMVEKLWPQLCEDSMNGLVINAHTRMEMIKTAYGMRFTSKAAEAYIDTLKKRRTERVRAQLNC